MEIESGNVANLDTHGTGWFVGFSAWTRSPAPEAPSHPGRDLRFMPRNALSHSLQMKWMVHPAGDPRGMAKPASEGRTVSIMVSETGRFQLEFAPDVNFAPAMLKHHLLQRHGDFVIWGAGLHHRWRVEEACVILTLRWTPIADS